VSGLWRYAGGQAEPSLSRHDVRYEGGRMRYTAHRHREPEARLAGCVSEARCLLLPSDVHP
jgi:hypothetical protein